MKRLKKRDSFIVLLFAIIILALIIYAIKAEAKGQIIDCWAFCKPKDRVNLRMKPSKESQAVGWLECGDQFQTDGTKRGGWLKVLDRGECECWIYSGYVVKEQPVEVSENYVCVAKKWVACRRWVNGPQIKGRLGWLHNGSNVNVYYIAGEWAVTSRGYIRSEWLEADPV